MALIIVWSLLTAISWIAMLLLIFGSAQWITLWSERLTVPHDHCALCGMTQAFLALKEGNFEEARQFNPSALTLLVVTVLNSLALVSFYFLQVIKQLRRPTRV
jgi:hypothetical protein